MPTMHSSVSMQPIFRLDRSAPVEPTTEREVLPVVPRESIRWRTVGSRLEITFLALNPAPVPTPAGRMTVAAAAFGAFVPSTPVAQVPIPSLAPREAVKLRADVSREEVNRASEWDEVREMLGLLEDAEWAGNLDVYFEDRRGRAVEVHRADNVEVHVGRGVWFLFFVHGGPAREALVRCDQADWETRVMLGRGGRWPDTFLGPRSHDIARWVQRRGTGTLLVRAPQEAERRAHVVVDVVRERDGHVVPVEFTFTSTTGRTRGLGCRRSGPPE